MTDIKEEIKKRAEELADEHWQYIKEILDTVMPNRTKEDKEIKKGFYAILGFYYKTAFVYGYKHGIEDQTFFMGYPVFDKNGNLVRKGSK